MTGRPKTAFVVAEVEEPVAADRAARRRAELILPERLGLADEEVARVETVSREACALSDAISGLH